jgi:hypothetical protein
MNQLAGVGQGMQQLNLHGTPPRPNQTGMVSSPVLGMPSPTGFQQFPGMYGGAGAQTNFSHTMK